MEPLFACSVNGVLRVLKPSEIIEWVDGRRKLFVEVYAQEGFMDLTPKLLQLKRCARRWARLVLKRWKSAQ